MAEAVSLGGENSVREIQSGGDSIWDAAIIKGDST